MTPNLRVGGPAGVPLATLVLAMNDLEITHEWPEGGMALTVSILLPTTERPPQISEKEAFDLMIGARPIWPGYLSEVNWADGTLTAKGSITEGDSTPCLTPGGLTTSTPDVAIDTAISSDEVSWTRPASISSSPYSDSGDETSNLNTVSDLLAVWQTEADKRIYVDPHRAIRVASDPTTPTYYLLPGTDELSWATQASADRITARYQATAAGALANVTVTAPGAKKPYAVKMLDLTSRGVLTATRASDIVNGIMADSTSGSWANGITVTSHQIAGNPDLAQVAEDVGQGRGRFIKLGQRDPRPGRVPVGFIDFVCGQSVWRPADDTITLSPIGTVARDWETVLGEYGAQEAS